jgi:hypothetical protein
VGKVQSPLLGFNNNIRHRGRTFHVQTEDSGVKYPHVITHLFADGGRILESVKTSYAEYIGSSQLQETVANLMKEQHKAMIIRLRDGHFDDRLDGDSGTSAVRPTPGSLNRAQPETASATQESVKGTAPTERLPQAPTEPLDVDVSVLERAAAARSHSFFVGDDLPPPPASVFPGQKPSGSYRSIGGAPPSSDAPSPRYSAPRPAAIFGATKPSKSSQSVFGENSLSGKSLDEVILSFLAEEFGPSSIDDKGENQNPERREQKPAKDDE